MNFVRGRRERTEEDKRENGKTDKFSILHVILQSNGSEKEL